MENPIIPAQQGSNDQQKMRFFAAPSPVFILGAAYSGKSEIAPQFFADGQSVLAFGTCSVEDESLRHRIETIKGLRPKSWKSIDCGPDLATKFQESAGGGARLIDSLSQWVGEVLIASMSKYDPSQVTAHFDQERDTLFTLMAKQTTQRLVLISTEVGSGPPPQREWSRLYRQKVGETNQLAARLANSVFLVNAGILTRIK